RRHVGGGAMNASGGGYRAEIDGLRAVAVVAVVLFHLGFRWIPGGFVGVDVFFVISGYLITGIIRRDLAAGSFSLAGFYERRIRRIFPALAAVLVLSLAAGHRVLLPLEFRELGAHAAASVAFAENFLLFGESGYFAPAAERMPLLHLWSLAIEEQFYLAYPLLVLVAHRLGAPLRTTLALLAAASLASCLIAIRTDSSAAFYLPRNRAWELLAGGLLATTSLGQRPLARRWSAECASITGIAILAFAAISLNARTPYPGWHALLPVGATALLLAAGGTAWLNRRILSNRALVAIGLVSYPLYLFHWPVLSYLHLSDGATFGYLPGRILVALAVAALAAAVTFIALEKPIRRREGRAVVASLCLGMAAIGAFGAAVARGLVPNGVESECVKQVLAAIEDRPRASLPATVRPDRGTWTLGGSGARTLVYGDSMVEQCLPRFVRLLENAAPEGRGAIVIADGGAIPIPGVRNPGTRTDLAALEQRFRRAIEEDPSIDRVVISGGWLGYFSAWTKCTIDGVSLAEEAGRDAALASFEELLASLLARGKRVTVVLAYPGWPSLDPVSFLDRGLGGVACVAPPPVTVAEMEARIPGFVEIQQRLRELCARLGVEAIDPLEFLAPDGVCVVADANGPIRYDSAHLRASYVREHLRFLDHAFAP
ncbi:MAG: acyltransferase family protein, partial [Planctomycetota bacterium]